MGADPGPVQLTFPVCRSPLSTVSGGFFVYLQEGPYAAPGSTRALLVTGTSWGARCVEWRGQIMRVSTAYSDRDGVLVVFDRRRVVFIPNKALPRDYVRRALAALERFFKSCR